MHICSPTGRFADVDKVKKKSTRETVVEEESASESQFIVQQRRVNCYINSSHKEENGCMLWMNKKWGVWLHTAPW